MTALAQPSAGPRRLFPTHRHVLRLTLEAVTPLSIAGGRPDPLLDTSLIRDANGLPAIPATSVAGVLRRLHEDYFGEDATQVLFGVEHGGSTEGRASALEVSFGCLQDSNGHAVEGLLLGKAGAERLADPILSAAILAAPLKRDHVALDARGTAIEHLKFERSSLPPGYRFSLELALWSGVNAREDVEALAAADAAKQARAELARVLALFEAPYFRLGGATRRGLGRLQVVGAAQYAAFDMRRAEDRRRHADARARGLHEASRTDGFVDFAPAALPAEGGMRQPVTATITLRPRGVWRFGRGEQW
ncbi:MAG: hypothetical protein EPO55_00780, partial [Reyranella sp.]|uniref:RAMP superfamily CRISPR-associated protein n=1 Tax=Reyranella sp. TaxID=1929291 RepID=UPI00122B904E